MDATGEQLVELGPVKLMLENRTVMVDGAKTRGPTLRVLGADDEHEYLRFDLFEPGPHYHYRVPEGSEGMEKVLSLDTVAEGNSLDWLMRTLRARLAPMLAAAGGGALAERLNGDQVQVVLDDVEQRFRAM